MVCLADDSGAGGEVRPIELAKGAWRRADSPSFVTLVALILVAARAFSRSAGRSVGPRRVEAVAKLAGLRDRGALTEDELQREKQRLLA